MFTLKLVIISKTLSYNYKLYPHLYLHVLINHRTYEEMRGGSRLFHSDAETL